MTTFGKILVFINLVFSLVVCALVIMVYIARTNWKDAFERQRQVAEAAQASSGVSAEQQRTTYQDADKQVQVMQASADRMTKDLETAKKDLAAKEDEYQKELKKSNGLNAQAQKLLVDVQRRAEEVKKLEENQAKLTDRMTEVVKEMNRLREQSVDLEVKNRSLKARSERLEIQLAEAQKDVIRMKTPATTVAGKPSINPPPENVEGVIKGVDSTGLVSITIGSDSGVLKGHTLEVYRLDPSPLYLGTIKILETRPHEAVGQPLARPRAPIQTGDRVASRIIQGG